MKTKQFLYLLVVSLIILTSCNNISLPVIVYGNQPSESEQMAAKEVRRYLYLRTGKLADIQEVASEKDIPAYAIVLSTKAGKLSETTVENLPDNESYRLKTEGTRLYITGASDIALLYGTYKFAEQLGVRFYLHGDVIPDQKMASFVLPELDEVHTPLFATRGIQPFHDFPEGPDWWTLNEYKAILAQLPKMGMNFIGLHTYPQSGVGPEPLVWIGLKSDLDDKGRVKTAYPARHFYTTEKAWGYAPKLTKDYSFGASDWFNKDIYALDYMDGKTPATTDEQSIAVFNETGDFFSEALSYAKQWSVKVCIGTETPMTVPDKVKEQLKEQKINPADSSVIRQLYEGSFEWIKKHYPADYYWLWTPEYWTWSGNTQQQLDATLSDMQSALRALDNVKPGFGLATCGWVLGPQQNRAMFDQYLPKNIPFSCINRNVGGTPIDAGFVDIQGRSKWAIPWLEDDPTIILPQLWAGRMRRDAADALAYGCDGLIGIHWRTQSIAQNIAALARAGWEQQGWNTGLGQMLTKEEAEKNVDLPKRDLDATDFYADWARSEFGEEAADQLAGLFVRLDGTSPDNKNNRRLPNPATWVDGPGGLVPDPTAWQQRAETYAFVDEMASYRPLIKGNGNLARFDYWLNTFRYLKEVGALACTIGEYNLKAAEIRKINTKQEQKESAKNILLPLRIQAVKQLLEIHRYLFSFLNTYGELGNLANWQQHVMHISFEKPVKELEELIGDKLPAEAYPDQTPVYTPRIIVPEIRTTLNRGEDFSMQLIVTEDSPTKAELKYRVLGKKAYQTVALQPVGRKVYQVKIPANQLTDDFEYYIKVAKPSSETLHFPATAPDMNQTVVIR